MANIPHVAPLGRVKASEQNALIDRVNQNTTAIENLSVPGGDTEIVQEMIDDSIDIHSAAPLPHAAYDDLPSLKLLFENGLV